MLFAGDKPMDVAGNPVVKWLSRHIPITNELHGEKFFVRVPDTKTGKLVLAATPLFLALVVINLADLVFAVDSVPAIFAITTDTFIVYTSNIMAILGLRALYFALSAMVHPFPLSEICARVGAGVHRVEDLRRRFHPGRGQISAAGQPGRYGRVDCRWGDLVAGQDARGGSRAAAMTR